MNSRPVLQEKGEREDASSYGELYWMVFPLNNVKVEGQGQFEVSLTLAGRPPPVASPVPRSNPVASQTPPQPAPVASPPASAERGGVVALPAVALVFLLAMLGTAVLVLRRFVRQRTKSEVRD